VITVELRDAFGNPIAAKDVAISFATTLGKFPNGLSTISIDTDENGLASTRLASTKAGIAEVTAALDGAAVTSGFVEINFQPGEVDHLAIDPEPIPERAGDPFATQPVVTIRDSFDNIVINDNETEIVVSIAAGNEGVLGGTTTMNVSAGIASFADLTFGGIVG